MKKLALIVCVLMLLSKVACADNNGKPNNTGNADNDADIADDVTDDNNVVDGNDAVDEGAVTDDKNGDINDGNNQTLTGKAQGYGGEVTVTVEVNGDDIVSVKAVGEKETQGVGSNAIEQLPERIEKADSTDVDAVSGATVTSNAIKEAVDQALEGIK